MSNQENQVTDTDSREVNESANESLPEAAENEAQIGVSEEIPNKEQKDSKDLSVQYQELNDRFLRLYSEFDNYKKRNARERIELSKTAGADIITGLLVVLDDFDRAVKAMESTSDVEGLREGVQLIHQKFKAILVQKGLEEMITIGETFNSDFHEAITSIPAPEEKLKGCVLDEVEKGYSLNGKVIRYAKVVVGN